MLRLPVCGFSKRVDDTVARAMTIFKPAKTIQPNDQTSRQPQNLRTT